MTFWRLLSLTLALVALFLIGCDREITGDVTTISDNSDENCLDCHSGLLDAAQGEWANSVHASGNNVDYTNRGGSDCTRCHDQQGFIAFLETGMLPDEPFSSVSAIGCFTCHNPHENGDFSLRATEPFTLANGDVFDHEAGNLCAACHHSRLSSGTIEDGISVSRYWGPHHGPQGDMLNGSNGWEFPGEGYSFESSPHATVVRDACAGCHMGNTRAHDGYKIGGHSFNMVDEETGSDLVGLCEECHTDAESYDIDGAQTEIVELLDSLNTLLVNAGVLDGTAHPVSGTIADRHVAGAVFNFLLIEEDRSHGVHNYKYAKSLLEASIDYMENLPARSPIFEPITMLTTH